MDPDHLVAVSTLVAEQRRLRPAVRLGLLWGLGHLLPVALLGLPLLLLNLRLPPALEEWVDLGVGLLLVALGAGSLLRLSRERLHSHRHAHGRYQHVHFHAHRHGPGHAHVHPAPAGPGRTGLLTFGVGMVHGLAGSGAAAVLALAAAPSALAGAGYLLVFGAGTCLGMLLATVGLVLPAVASTARFGGRQAPLRVAAGLASVGVGAFMLWERLPLLLSGALTW